MTKRLVLAVLAAAGCSTSVNGGGPSGTGAAETSTAIAGPRIISCTTDDSGTACQYTAPQGYPIAFSSVVTLISPTAGTTQSATLDDGAVHTLTVGTGAQLLVQVNAKSGIQGLINGDLSTLQQTVTAQGTQTFTIPYDIWPIQLDGAASMQPLSPTKMSVDISPWQTFFGSTTASLIPTLPEKPADQTITTAVIAARDAHSIAGTAVFCAANNCATQPYVLSGPGTYDATASGLALATASPPADMSQPVDTATAPDLATACGGANQAPCTDSAGNPTCTAGTVYTWANNICVACGNDQELACTDASNNQICNSGTINVSGLCKACGAAHQQVCRDASNNPICNAGLSPDANGNCS